MSEQTDRPFRLMWPPAWRLALAVVLGTAFILGSGASSIGLAAGVDKKAVASNFRARNETVPRGGKPGATRGLTVKSKTRGLVRNVIWPVVPPDVGLTAMPSPVIYWYSTGRLAGPAYVTITAAGAKDPVLDVTLAGGVEPGFNMFDLAEYGVGLRPQVDYEWYLTVVPPGADGAPADAIGGRVRYVPTGTADLAQLASSGYWYDTFQAVADDTDALTIMLEQADLSDLASKLRGAY